MSNHDTTTTNIVVSQAQLPLSILRSSNNKSNNNHFYDDSISGASVGKATAVATTVVSNKPSISTTRSVSSSLSPLSNDNNDNNNNQITDPLAYSAVATLTTYGSNLPTSSAKESTTTTTLPPSLSQQQRDNNDKTKDKDVVIDPAFLESRLSSPFFVNYIMTTRPPIHANCHRTCVDFRNKIYFSTEEWLMGAGLMDRLTIFATLLNMAGYLCARLYVPRPKFMLAAKHNYHQQKIAATNITWSEFGSFCFWNDPTQQNALVDWDNPNDVEELPISETLQDEPAAIYQFAKLPLHVKKQFVIFEKYTFKQQQQLADARNNNEINNNNNNIKDRFIWRIQAEYFSWTSLLANYLRKRSLHQDSLMEPFIFAYGKFFVGCQYAKVEPARHLQELREKIVQQILRPSSNTTLLLLLRPPPPPLVIYLHVRRQDAKGECNTNTKEIKAFLNCSLGESILQLSKVLSSSNNNYNNITPSRSIKILFSSDEVDQRYRQKVLQFIEEQQSHLIHVTAIDLDQLVEETIRTV